MYENSLETQEQQLRTKKQKLQVTSEALSRSISCSMMRTSRVSGGRCTSGQDRGTVECHLPIWQFSIDAWNKLLHQEHNRSLPCCICVCLWLRNPPPRPPPPRRCTCTISYQFLVKLFNKMNQKKGHHCSYLSCIVFFFPLSPLKHNFSGSLFLYFVNKTKYCFGLLSAGGWTLGGGRRGLFVPGSCLFCLFSFDFMRRRSCESIYKK